MGTVLIAEALKNAVEGRGSTVDWDEIAETARHMKVSSLCGIGCSQPSRFWERSKTSELSLKRRNR